MPRRSPDWSCRSVMKGTRPESIGGADYSIRASTAEPLREARLRHPQPLHVTLASRLRSINAMAEWRGATHEARLAMALVAAIAALSLVAARPGPPPLTAGDVRWLARVTFGIDTATARRYQQLGREKFLDEQLHPANDDPAPLAAAIAAIPVTQQTAEARVKANRAEQ